MLAEPVSSWRGLPYGGVATGCRPTPCRLRCWPQVFTTGRRLVLLNRHQVSARRGLIITGAAGTGKTTAITQLGRNHELLLRQRLGRQATAGRMPVVYVTVPPATTPKMLAAEFARFAGVPTDSRRQNQADITNAVCDVLARLRTDLVLVDEIHNLNLATRTGAEASDQLKYLAERVPATFVFSELKTIINIRCSRVVSRRHEGSR
jgi:hypothetical protein